MNFKKLLLEVRSFLQIEGFDGRVTMSKLCRMINKFCSQEIDRESLESVIDFLAEERTLIRDDSGNQVKFRMAMIGLRTSRPGKPDPD